MTYRKFVHSLQIAAALICVTCFSAQAAPLNACDLNGDQVVNKADVDLAVAMSTGATSPCTANIIGNGVCNVVMVQRVVNAAQGGNCGRVAKLAWTASNSANVTGYRIYRGTVNGGAYTLLTSAPVSGTTYTDSSAQPGTTYYYVVTAVNSSNSESIYSNQASATIPNP